MKNYWFLLLFIMACNLEAKESKELLSFKLLLVDSSTVYNTNQIPKGKPFVVVYFSPDCEPCQKETENLLKNMDNFKNVSFYFLTVDPFDRMKVFYYYYKLQKYPNILVGRDFEYSFFHYYKPGTTPYLGVYDENKRLRVVFSGEENVENIRRVIDGL